VINELKKRDFTDKQGQAAQADACMRAKVTAIEAFNIDVRNRFLLAIRAGFFDRFKEEETPKASKRPARAVAGK
jgi:hypothetical protein